MSCMVDSDAVIAFLESRGADRDDSGFRVYGPEPPISFMGAGDELVLPESLQYAVSGKPHSLAADLLAAGIGVGITVVSEVPAM